MTDKISRRSNIRTRQGIYNGFVDKRGVKTWLGIPYAKPPVGKFRWHAPEPLEPGNKEFDAKKFGRSPMQSVDSTEDASRLPQSEDCLTLNIWTRGAKNNLPVMIFIPGGGFVGGGNGDPDNVTIFGESVGSTSVMFRMIIPPSSWQRAVVKICASL